MDKEKVCSKYQTIFFFPAVKVKENPREKEKQFSQRASPAWSIMKLLFLLATRQP